MCERSQRRAIDFAQARLRSSRAHRAPCRHAVRCTAPRHGIRKKTCASRAATLTTRPLAFLSRNQRRAVRIIDGRCRRHFPMIISCRSRRHQRDYRHRTARSARIAARLTGAAASECRDRRRPPDADARKKRWPTPTALPWSAMPSRSRGRRCCAISDRRTHGPALRPESDAQPLAPDLPAPQRELFDRPAWSASLAPSKRRAVASINVNSARRPGAAWGKPLQEAGGRRGGRHSADAREAPDLSLRSRNLIADRCPMRRSCSPPLIPLRFGTAGSVPGDDDDP